MNQIIQKTSRILLAISLAFITACGGEDTSTESHEGSDIKVELDNGKHWKANEETIQGIKNMQSMMMVSKEPEMNTESCTALKEELKIEFNLIFERCDMTGEAHEQLHNFLYPLMGMINGLDQGSIDDCQNYFEDIEIHLSRFTDYFE